MNAPHKRNHNKRKKKKKTKKQRMKRTRAAWPCSHVVVRALARTDAAPMRVCTWRCGRTAKQQRWDGTIVYRKSIARFHPHHRHQLYLGHMQDGASAAAADDVCVCNCSRFYSYKCLSRATILVALRVRAYKWSTSHRWSNRNYTTHEQIPLLVDRNRINCVINGSTTTCAPHNSVGASKIYWMNELNFIFVLATRNEPGVRMCVCVFVSRSHFASMTIPMRILLFVYGPKRAWYLLCIGASTRIKPLRTMMTNIVMPAHYCGIDRNCTSHHITWSQLLW